MSAVKRQFIEIILHFVWAYRHISRDLNKLRLTPWPSDKTKSEALYCICSIYQWKTECGWVFQFIFAIPCYNCYVENRVNASATRGTESIEKSAFSRGKSSRLFSCQWLVYVSWPPSDHNRLVFLYCLVGKCGVVLLFGMFFFCVVIIVIIIPP